MHLIICFYLSIYLFIYRGCLLFLIVNITWGPEHLFCLLTFLDRQYNTGRNFWLMRGASVISLTWAFSLRCLIHLKTSTSQTERRSLVKLMAWGACLLSPARSSHAAHFNVWFESTWTFLNFLWTTMFLFFLLSFLLGGYWLLSEWRNAVTKMSQWEVRDRTLSLEAFVFLLSFPNVSSSTFWTLVGGGDAAVSAVTSWYIVFKLLFNCFASDCTNDCKSHTVNTLNQWWTLTFILGRVIGCAS